MSNIQSTEFGNIIKLKQEAQGRVRQYTNTALVTLYFDIGKLVSDKLVQGTVQQLADYIQTEIPTLKSFNRRGLYLMKQSYETYCPKSEFDVALQNIVSLNIENKDNDKVLAVPTQISFEFMSTELTQLQKPQNEKVSLVLTQLENDSNSGEIQFVPPLVTQLCQSNHLHILAKTKTVEEKLSFNKRRRPVEAYWQRQRKSIKSIRNQKRSSTKKC